MTPKTIIAGILIVAFQSCHAQQQKNNFVENNYTFLRFDSDSNYLYSKLYVNKRDTLWKLRKIYFDKKCTILMETFFTYKNIEEGPFSTFVKGKLLMKGTFLHGKTNGELLTFDNGKIIRKQNYCNGLKCGEWLEYSKNGKIIRKQIFDNNGNLLEEIAF